MLVQLCGLIANEPRSDEQGGAYEYFEPLFKLAKSLDKQKDHVLLNILFATPDKCLVSSLCDVICLNRYYGWYIDMSDYETAREHAIAELNMWHEKNIQKTINIY